MKSILEKTGFVNVFSLSKVRKKAVFRGFEINLDRVEGLGEYVEIALVSENHGSRKALISFIRELGFREDQIEHRGYAAIVSHRMGIKFEGTQG
jgi:predicted adenylyl cyclase CyaB